MASTASDLLKFEKQTTGENATTWGTKANTAMSRIEEAIAGMSNIAVTGANYTLDDTQYTEHNDGSNTSESHVAIIKTSGTLTGNRSVIVPDRTKTYLFWNTNAGAYTLTAKTSGGTGVIIPQGGVQLVFCDGTNVEAHSLGITNDGTTLLDTNGNELTIYTTVASAVNEFTVSNAASGSGPQLEATGGDSNIDVELIPKGTGKVKSGSTAVALAGVHSIPIPASGMYTASTNGAAAGATETSTNKVMLKTWDFDTSTDEYVQFQVPMPKSWNEGTITYRPYWTVTGTNTGTVAWQLGGVGMASDDTINAVFGTLVATTALAHSGTSNDLMVSATSGAVTIAGSPAAGELCFFQLNRDISADAQTGDARLLGIKIFYTTDTHTDT